MNLSIATRLLLFAPLGLAALFRDARLLLFATPGAASLSLLATLGLAVHIFRIFFCPNPVSWGERSSSGFLALVWTLCLLAFLPSAFVWRMVLFLFRFFYSRLWLRCLCFSSICFWSAFFFLSVLGGLLSVVCSGHCKLGRLLTLC